MGYRRRFDGALGYVPHRNLGCDQGVVCLHGCALMQCFVHVNDKLL